MPRLFLIISERYLQAMTRPRCWAIGGLLSEVVGPTILTLLLDNSTPRLASDLAVYGGGYLILLPLYPFLSSS